MAMVMSGMPEVVSRLLEEHVPDRLGRCRACGANGSGTRWPCTLAQIATQARAVAAERGRAKL
jgi:hypothetical protein